MTRGVVERTMFNPAEKDLFKPMHVTHERLLALGIKGKQPAVSFQVNLDEQLKASGRAQAKGKSAAGSSAGRVKR